MRHTLAVLVQNKAGVLARVAGLFSRRGFNIESISVGTTEMPGISRMTLVAQGDDDQMEQLTKQLHKLIDVLKISDITHDQAVERELALIKVNAEPSSRAEVLQVVDIFRGKVVDVGDRSVIVEVTGDTEKVEAMIQLMRPYGIKELVRTGTVSMVRGTRSMGQAAD
ncbi:MAG TPA: acetolactate synthase small subunit [Firmicutes bacterium]|nr:acetolactate synthase small subunit [Bacillota bacterium]